MRSIWQQDAVGRFEGFRHLDVIEIMIVNHGVTVFGQSKERSAKIGVISLASRDQEKRPAGVLRMHRSHREVEALAMVRDAEEQKGATILRDAE